MICRAAAAEGLGTWRPSPAKSAPLRRGSGKALSEILWARGSVSLETHAIGRRETLTRCSARMNGEFMAAERCRSNGFGQTAVVCANGRSNLRPRVKKILDVSEAGHRLRLDVLDMFVDGRAGERPHAIRDARASRSRGRRCPE